MKHNTSEEGARRNLRKDPGSLLLIIYSLIITAFLLIGTFSQASPV